MAELVDVVDGLDDFVSVGGSCSMLGGGEPEGFDFFAEGGECVGVGRVGELADPVGDEPKVSGRSDFGIELLDGAGAGIAWVHEEVVAGFFAFLVDAFELGQRDVDLASDFEDFGDSLGIELEGE